MPLRNAYIAYGTHWSTPFSRWQGSLSGFNAVELAAQTTSRVFKERGLDPRALDSVVLGSTVPQKQSFYGAPWLAGLIGAPDISGPNISQACATSVRSLLSAALEVEAGMRRATLVVTCDRTSNGPHIYYPDPQAPGGRGKAEDWVWDNFNKDPWGGTAMLATAENVARESKITRDEQHEVTLLRHRQYQDALANDRAFQRRYMVGVDLPRGKSPAVLDADEGVFLTTAEGLAKLKPVLDGGTVTYGAQTFPADGNAGLVVATRERVAELARGEKVPVQILGFGDARVKKSFMPMAVVPAAERALEHAGLMLAQMKAIKTHNPFAVNDIYFCRTTGVSPEKLNHYGSPLIFGHPQGPTGLRCLIELIEELAIAGGGHGLYTGCAAGDTAMAVVIKVG